MSKRSKNGKKRLRKFVNDLRYVLEKHNASIVAFDPESIHVSFEDMNVICDAKTLNPSKVSICLGEDVVESI